MSSALVIGRAIGVFDEIAAAKALTTFDYVLAVGPIAVDYPDQIDCWVWFHTEFFMEHALKRAAKGYPPVNSYWSVKYKGRVRSNNDLQVKFFDWNEGGSSGLVAVMIALSELKADRVVLAGCPMTIEGGKYDTTPTWTDAEKHRHSWIKHLPKLQGRVKSLSGWTAELLGAPTAEWLREVDSAAA